MRSYGYGDAALEEVGLRLRDDEPNHYPRPPVGFKASTSSVTKFSLDGGQYLL
jgi:hypothetical protein